MTIERLAYRRLRNSATLNVLITAIGVSLLLEYSGQKFFGAATPDIAFEDSIRIEEVAQDEIEAGEVVA